MTFLLRWLGLNKPAPSIGLRPHRNVDVPLDYDAAYARLLSAIELTLGAHVAIEDRRTGFVEAAFGLVNNERIRCTLERIDQSHTRIRVEAFFPAGAIVQSRSAAVDALTDSLSAGV